VACITSKRKDHPFFLRPGHCSSFFCSATLNWDYQFLFSYFPATASSFSHPGKHRRGDQKEKIAPGDPYSRSQALLFPLMLPLRSPASFSTEFSCLFPPPLPPNCISKSKIFPLREGCFSLVPKSLLVLCWVDVFHSSP